MIVKMIKSLENKMEKMQESINKGLEDMIRNQSIMNNSLAFWRKPTVE